MPLIFMLATGLAFGTRSALQGLYANEVHGEDRLGRAGCLPTTRSLRSAPVRGRRNVGEMPCPRCRAAMEKGFLKDRAWMSGDGPRTLFLRDRQAANIVAWRCMGCGKVELEIEQ